MTLTSIGDLSQLLFRSTRSSAIRQNIENLTYELSSGQVRDVNAKLKGDFAYLADIESNLTVIEGHSVAAVEAGLFFEAAQQRLGRLQDVSQDLSNVLISSIPSALAPVQEQIIDQAGDNLVSMIEALNGSVAGLSLFAGTDTDQVPLASADDLLADLMVVIGGATTVAGIRLAAQTWFDDPFGFELSMYGGSTTGVKSVEVSEGESVTMSLRANDAVFRDVLMNTALAALAGEPFLGFDQTLKNEILLASGEGLAQTQDDLSAVRGDVGFSQSRIENAQARLASTRVSLNTARTALLEADPFETAIRLEDAQFRLESLYQVTARTTRLSLVNFL
jgi:flagellar hook-associated protein 3 FlgL